MVYYWVCNTEKDIKTAIKYGACGVMTDDPILLDEILKK
jgi:glycerophosphoryl diester phosphodiesterase